MTKIRWGRLILSAMIAEAIPIILLIGLVAQSGAEGIDAEVYAAELGRWVGPIGGAVATFILAIWVVRPLKNHRILHGCILGVLVAFIDATLLFLSNAPFQWLFFFSGIGRVVAGFLGGYLISTIASR